MSAFEAHAVRSRRNAVVATLATTFALMEPAQASWAMPMCSVLIPDDFEGVSPDAVAGELHQTLASLRAAALLHEDVDELSLMSTGAEVRRAVPSGLDAAPSVGIDVPDVPEDDGEWEHQFAWGVYHSQVLLEVEDDAAVVGWSRTTDASGRSAAAPNQMLRAEELLLQAVESAPQAQRKSKLAERALRVYYHAKWLAERNFEASAELRYREAAKLALQCRRSVLASHSLSRLGYYMIHWRRPEEARVVLQEAEKLNKKSNALAPYLYGLLERQAAGPDEARLLAAEERILREGELPSEELEGEREALVREIGYWRAAQASPQNCLATTDAAHALICLCSHSGLAVRHAFQNAVR